MKLPSGYKRLAYIQSSGTQYVKTGIFHNPTSCPGLRMVIDAEILSTTGSELNGIGSYQSFYVGQMNGYLYYSPYYGDFNTNVAYAAIKRYIYDLDNAANKFAIKTTNGTQVYSTNTTVGIPAGSREIYLFAFNSSDSGTVGGYTKQKLYSCQIYDNGTLVRDYVPCLNPSGVAGLYELVNGVFYGNAGTGTFAAGRRVYDKSEIAKLAYIESNGTQYVDTDFKPNNNTRVVMDMQYVGNEGISNEFGAWSASNTDAFICLSTENRTNVYPFYGKASQAVSINRTARHTVDMNKNVVSINGVAKVTFPAATFSCSYPLYLCCFNNAGATENMTALIIYSCQIYGNGTLVRDYHPVRAGDEVGLWDALTGEFYPNSGTGAFIAGPVLVTMETPENLAAIVTKDGIVLSWDKSENAIGYKVYRNAVRLAETANTTYTDRTVEFDGTYTYGVSAYDKDTETARAEITVFVETPYSPADLVTDRTEADRQRAEYLAALDYREMTEEEKTEWDSDPKGAYNPSDLNRVERSVKHLAGELRSLEPELKEYAAELDVHWEEIYAPPYDGAEMNPSTKTNWQKSDEPKPSDMTRYLGNVKLLRSSIDYATDALPESVEEITWSGANAIEKALMGLDSAIIMLRADKKTLIDNTAEAWFFSGEIFSGEV